MSMKNNSLTRYLESIEHSLHDNKKRQWGGFYYGSFTLIIIIIVMAVIATYQLTCRAKTVVEIVNLSDRQRILSERIVLYSKILSLETDNEERQVLANTLRNTVNLMAQTHQTFTQQNASLLLPKGMSKIIRSLYFSKGYDVDAIVLKYISHTRDFLDGWQESDGQDLDLSYIQNSGLTSVITNLDMIVDQYQKEGEAALSLIIKLERAALIAGLCLITLQLLFIFRPLTARIDKQVHDLENSQVSAHEFERLALQLKTALNEHSLVSATDAKGNIVFANEKFCEVSGYSVAELMGKNHNMLKSSVHNAAFFRGLWKTISSGQVWHGEICNISKSGQPYWVQSTIVPFLHDKTGEPIQYVSVRTDITAQKIMQEKMDELIIKTLVASDAKTNFISNMSHELRTPLNHIIGFSDLIELKTKDPDMLENIGYVKSAGYELLDKINNVLTLASHHATSDRLPKVFDIVKLINVEFIDFFKQITRHAHKKIVITIPDHEILVNVDRMDLLAAFRGIAKNAVDYSGQDDEVGISVIEDRYFVTVAIFDTGSGIPESILTPDLEPFTIGEALITKRNSGMGLGLSLAKKLCLKNNGIFEIENNKDIGTRIYFRFPIFEPEEGNKKIFKIA